MNNWQTFKHIGCKHRIQHILCVDYKSFSLHAATFGAGFPHRVYNTPKTNTQVYNTGTHTYDLHSREARTRSEIHRYTRANTRLDGRAEELNRHRSEEQLYMWQRRPSEEHWLTNCVLAFRIWTTTCDVWIVLLLLRACTSQKTSKQMVFGHTDGYTKSEFLLLLSIFLRDNKIIFPSKTKVEYIIY